MGDLWLLYRDSAGMRELYRSYLKISWAQGLESHFCRA